MAALWFHVKRLPGDKRGRRFYFDTNDSQDDAFVSRSPFNSPPDGLTDYELAVYGLPYAEGDDE